MKKLTPTTRVPSLASKQLIGRELEMAQLQACLASGKSVLLEGPVGVGKTHLALAAVHSLDKAYFRIDGDSRYTEQKLSGWFDPPTVIKKGFTKDAFFAGPLVEAMQKGSVLFINELNRLPEGVQNVLLPALDEKRIRVPRLGEVVAEPGFLMIATQNPKEFVATSHLSEAILDRFELITVGYQSEADELKIVIESAESSKRPPALQAIASAAVRLIRLTRDHSRIRRGASIRAAISITDLAVYFVSAGQSLRDSFFSAVMMALPTRIEMERDAESEKSAQAEMVELLQELSDSAFQASPGSSEKKK